MRRHVASLFCFSGRLPRLSLLLLLTAAVAAPEGADAQEIGLSAGTRTSFGRDGLRVEQRQPARARGWQWEMPLRSFGRGASQTGAPSSGIARRAGRFEYRRGALTEWYLQVGPLIEQGFTLSERPDGSGPLSLGFELRTDLVPGLSSDGRSLHFDAPDGTRLRYSELAAFDARGTDLPARFVLDGREVILEVEDEGATYPLTIDPLIYMEAKQVAFDASTDDGYGASVGIDFDTAVVGAPGDDDAVAGDDVGAAYVYVRVRGAWVFQQKLVAADMETGDGFGSSVAIVGETIVVGAPGDDDAVAGADAGSAYLFRRTDGVWGQIGKLLAPDLAASDGFGSAVAASGDTALVGSPLGDGAVADSGSAYAFVFDPATATPPVFEAELGASDGGAGDNFGGSVSLDGETAVVGAYADDDAGSESGAAYVFVRDAAVWTEQQKLVASDAIAGDQFGWSVGVSGDTVAVGAPGDDDDNPETGAAYVFARFGTSWTELDEVFPQGGDNDARSGTSISISSDAILVGATGEDGSQGEVNLYAREGVEWPRVMRIRASDREDGDEFGTAVAISGGSLAVGAPLDDDLIPDQGGAYLFYANQVDIDLEVAVAVNDPQPAEGSEVVLTVNVTNWGEDDAEAVAIHAPFPAELTFVDSLASYGTYNVETGIWEIGDLPNYASSSLTLTGLAPVGSSGTTVTIEATLLAFDSTPENDTDTVTVEVGGQGTPTVNLCPSTPTPGCLASAKAVLKINEGKVGKEKLKVSLKNVGAATVPGDFGDPVGGTTIYDLCIYNQAGVLAGGLRVDRAGDTCGTALCWKTTSNGFKYSDPLQSAGGVKKMKTKSGAAGKGAVVASAGNNVGKGQTAMPVGIAGVLAGNTSATVQVLTDDAACFEALLGTVKQSDGIGFKAKTP